MRSTLRSLVASFAVATLALVERPCFGTIAEAVSASDTTARDIPVSETPFRSPFRWWNQRKQQSSPQSQALTSSPHLRDIRIDNRETNDPSGPTRTAPQPSIPIPAAMGQAMRIAKYDRAANERNAVTALTMAGQALSWYRLDDGVMGGKSDTQQHVTEDGVLHFDGTINTEGGGFASIRTMLPPGVLPSTRTAAIRLRVLGDGKTYKLFLTDGTAGGPLSRSPSWQADIPTRNDGTWQDVRVPLDSLLPNFGGGVRRNPNEDKANYTFVAEEMNQIGLMLSLKLSNGEPNPKETFGEGIFPFSLRVHSVEPVDEPEEKPSNT
jgi:hypothetical protein